MRFNAAGPAPQARELKAALAERVQKSDAHFDARCFSLPSLARLISLARGDLRRPGKGGIADAEPELLPHLLALVLGTRELGLARLEHPLQRLDRLRKFEVAGPLPLRALRSS